MVLHTAPTLARSYLLVFKVGEPSGDRMVCSSLDSNRLRFIGVGSGYCEEGERVLVDMAEVSMLYAEGLRCESPGNVTMHMTRWPIVSLRGLAHGLNSTCNCTCIHSPA